MLVTEAWSGVDVQLKRRYDLIPNLVEMVKGYSQFEKNTLEQVTRARSESSGVSDVAKRAELEQQLAKNVKGIFAVAEAYPDLKANRSFLELHKSLAEIENDLQYARRYYNGTVRDYNIVVQSVPSNLIAGAFHFTPAEFFEIEYVTEREVPDVKLA